MGPSAYFVATLGMILRTRGLPSLLMINLQGNLCGDLGVQALCAGLGHGSVPSLLLLDLGAIGIGPLGAEAIAAALRRGAMPVLESLYLSSNQIDDQGLTALGPALRKMPALKELSFHDNAISDEGVASFVADLGKNDFKVLTQLYLGLNKLTGLACATLEKSVKAGMLWNLKKVQLHDQEMQRQPRWSLRTDMEAERALNATLAAPRLEVVPIEAFL